MGHPVGQENGNENSKYYLDSAIVIIKKGQTKYIAEEGGLVVDVEIIISLLALETDEIKTIGKIFHIILISS